MVNIILIYLKYCCINMTICLHLKTIFSRLLTKRRRMRQNTLTEVAVDTLSSFSQHVILVLLP